MKPTIKIFPETKFIGKNLSFSYTDYRAFELWSSFMPRRNEIQNALGTDLFNIQINPENFDFNPQTKFVKWAVVPVSDFDFIPEGMQSLIIEEGLYAVFNHIGDVSKARETFGYIFGVWLPNSEYELDNRPQFEMLGEKYKNNAPDSEEEIWIPIKKRI
ncbi:GyrI-like domain-containing protein [Flavobacterium celericrescens]|uniref:GyrI-like domain-containing protein n=1 Tax=Flavobacterium celericrescens TaxID=2709780 RepID=A0ABX0IFM8_9FLAO|nr:GyrI-like domain-containing protein [Flavobacterium celericrescens]NHM05306.1 GyrI-like domain-containing protein [Flavobacterium celericrescens]